MKARKTSPRETQPETEPRHGHPITPGSAEGEREVVEQALLRDAAESATEDAAENAAEEEALTRQGGRRPSQVRTAGNRKKAA